jgi:hypothetical protein
MFSYDERVFCFVATNHKGIWYSREYIRGEFRKFYKDSLAKFRYYNGIPGHKYHSRGTYYRAVKTSQERRMAANVLLEENEPKWRSSRNTHNLVDRWDDIHHEDWRNRNWKRYRKTQWKTIKWTNPQMVYA